MRVNDFNENAANMTAAGMFGFEYYDVADDKTFLPPDGLRIAAIQTFEDTTVKKVIPSSDAVVKMPEGGFVVPAGMTIMINASEVKINSGTGMIYYGG